MATKSATEETRSAKTKTVMITGASSGIGRACALWMDRAGWQVFATVRKEDDALRSESDASASLRTILLDVTDPDQIAEAAHTVSDSIGGDGLSTGW